MATSTFPVAKASLLAKFRADPGYAGVAVDYGDPGIAKLQTEHVFMSGTGEDGQDWAPYGQLKRDEQYQIEFFVHAAQAGKTQQEATERAHVLFGVAESVIRPLARTPSSVAAGMYFIDIKPIDVREYALDEGYACFVKGVITCKARI